MFKFHKYAPILALNICFNMFGLEEIIYEPKYDNINLELIEACKQNNIEKFLRLFWHGASLDSQDQDGNTPLIISILNNNINMAKLLVSWEANCNICNINGDSVLMKAIELDNLEAFNLLINKTNLFFINKDNKSIFEIAENTNRLEITDNLNRKKQAIYKVFYNSVTGKTIDIVDQDIAKASELGHRYFKSKHISDLMIKVLSDFYTKSNIQDLFFLACMANYIPILELFITAKIINPAEVQDPLTFIKDKLANFDSIARCVDLGFIETAKFLINKGCDVNAVNHEDMTALMISALLGDLELVQLLLNKNSDINKVSKKHINILMFAALGKNLEIIKLLLNHKSLNKNFINIALIGPALKCESIEIFKLLVQHGLPIQVISLDNNTILMDAIELEAWDICDYLIKSNKIDLSLRNKKNETALTILSKAKIKYQNNVELSNKLESLLKELRSKNVKILKRKK